MGFDVHRSGYSVSLVGVTNLYALCTLPLQKARGGCEKAQFDGNPQLQGLMPTPVRDKNTKQVPGGGGQVYTCYHGLLKQVSGR